MFVSTAQTRTRKYKTKNLKSAHDQIDKGFIQKREQH